jgi:hypothetical protein
MSDLGLIELFAKSAKGNPLLFSIGGAALLLGIAVTVGMAVDGSLTQALRLGIYLILLFTFFAFIKLSSARWAQILANGAAALTAIAATIWLAFSSTSFFLNHNFFCGPVDDQNIVEPELTTGEWLLSVATGIEKTAMVSNDPKELCATAEVTVVVEAIPQYTVNTGTDQPIAARLPFSHRRSSCSGTSEGVFEACLPEGAILTEHVVTLVNERKGSFEDRGASVADDKKSRCVEVAWKAASGGRTGIGECRYHGLISFDVDLKGTLTVTTKEPISGEPVQNSKTVRGKANGMFVSFDNARSRTDDTVDQYQRLENWGFSVVASEWERQWFRPSQVWSDEAGSSRHSSSCLDVVPQNDPPGYWIGIDCDRPLNVSAEEATDGSTTSAD